MRKLRSLGPVVLVLLMAPVTAEYLIGYDDYITDPLALVFGVLFFAPLYGAPAVLIREVTRRFGLGWPTILLMATAFGLIEAGLIDQSLFDPAYRDITFWDDLRDPTFIKPRSIRFSALSAWKSTGVTVVIRLRMRVGLSAV